MTTTEEKWAIFFWVLALFPFCMLSLCVRGYLKVPDCYDLLHEKAGYAIFGAVFFFLTVMCVLDGCLHWRDSRTGRSGE